MEPKQVLGLDVGGSKTGIAFGSMVARLAQPLITLQSNELMVKLPEVIAQHNIDTIVVGLPRNLAGDDTKQTEWVRNWVKEAKIQIALPFYWQDEALTTKIAEAESRLHKKSSDPHSLAAAILLQDFLDTPEAQRVLC